MEKIDVFSLGRFNALMAPHLDSESPYGTQGKVYNELMYWIYGEDPGFAADRRAILAKWLQGSRPVNKKVMNTVRENLKYSCRNFGKVFQFLIDENTFVSAGNLTEELSERLQADPVLQRRELNLDEMDFCEVMAEAFTDALINNYVQNYVGIEPEVENCLKEMIVKCETDGHRFRTPHALFALLFRENSLMYGALECMQSGFGRQCMQKINGYVNAPHSQGYEAVEPDDLPFVFYAKKAAFYENKPAATERHVCEWIFACKSTAIDSLNRAIGKYDKSISAALDEALIRKVDTTLFDI